MSTARDLGLTKLSGRKGLYDFTSEGEDYCRNLTGKRIVECKSILKNTILKNPVWSNVLNFLRSNENNPRDPISLTIDIEKTLGKKWSEAMRTTVTDSLVSILEFSELVRREGGKIVSLLGPGEGFQPVTTQRYGPTPAIALSTGRISDSDSYEFRDEGVYIKIRKDHRSLALAKDLVDLFVRRHQSGLQTTKVEEAPGKN